MRRILFSSVFLLMCGCAEMMLDPKVKTDLIRVGGSKRPECDSLNCPDLWSKAQVWIVKHAMMKIQTATDTVIQTYNPVNNMPVYAFTILKEPIGGGRFRISMSLVCGNMFGCNIESRKLRDAFYHYLNTGEDVLPEKE